MCICLEEIGLKDLKIIKHIKYSEELVTPYEQTRAGFVSMALEKNRKATPYVEEAKALKTLASKVASPDQLLSISDISPAVLTAAGISDKATKHLTEENKTEAIKGLIENFLEPAGKDFIDELIYRFLLTKGDSLGGSVRNLAGVLGERKFSRTLISTLRVQGKDYFWLHSKTRKWVKNTQDDSDIEIHLKGVSWKSKSENRTLIYNLKVPSLGNNVDLNLFKASPKDMIFGNNKSSCHFNSSLYKALGELKGGIDPAGADEHWKTANSALERIRRSFSKEKLNPKTFFIGAAIEKAMAEEIYNQLLSGVLDNAANLTNESQLVLLCKWLIEL